MTEADRDRAGGERTAIATAITDIERILLQQEVPGRETVEAMLDELQRYCQQQKQSIDE